MFPQNMRRFAVFGIYLAGLAALASAGIYIVESRVTLGLQISLGLIIVGLALFVLLDPQRTREALTGRQARYGSNALLMTIAFIGIVVTANVLVNQNSKQWDLTEDKQNTLTEETLQVLKTLPASVQAEAFYTNRMPVDTASRLLQNYQVNSNGKFSYEIINPETDPIRAQQSNITRDGTIIVQMDGRKETLSYAGEQELTAALIRLANPGERAVYFLTGHGEYGLDTSQEGNLSTVKAALEAKNYTVSTLNLLATPTIPADALALIVPGPVKQVSAEEVKVIEAYLNQGGSLIYLSEPLPLTQFGDQPDPLADYLKVSWGIALDNDLIFDLSSSQQYFAISDRFGDHPITNKMYSQVLVLPTARSLQLSSAPAGVTATELAFTSNLAWGETDFQSIEAGQVSPDTNQDLIGPLVLAAAGINGQNGGRVVVIGDSDFVIGQNYDQYGNSDFLLNAIDWAAQQDNLISLTARQPIERLIVPPQGASMGLLLLGSIFLLPSVVIATGVTVWLQRRRRG